MQEHQMKHLSDKKLCIFKVTVPPQTYIPHHGYECFRVDHDVGRDQYIRACFVQKVHDVSKQLDHHNCVTAQDAFQDCLE
jgi:hypothetical protein